MAYLKMNGDNFLVIGCLPKSAEYKTVGEKNSSLTKFAVKACEIVDENGNKTANWTNCVAWHNVARACMDFKKGDVVAVMGKMETRSYQAADGTTKQVRELIVEFAQKMIVPEKAEVKQQISNDSFNNLEAYEQLANGPLPF